MTFYLREGLKGMLFPSEVFLFMFLPFVLAIYYLVLRKHTKGKNIFLLVMSLLFYAYGEPKYVFLMLFIDFVPLHFRFVYRKVPFKMDSRFYGRCGYLCFGIL